MEIKTEISSQPLEMMNFTGEKMHRTKATSYRVTRVQFHSYDSTRNMNYKLQLQCVRDYVFHNFSRGDSEVSTWLETASAKSLKDRFSCDVADSLTCLHRSLLYVSFRSTPS